MTSDITDQIDIDTLLDFGESFARLGRAVHDQIEDLLDDQFEELNHNAVELINAQLGPWHADIRRAARRYEKWSQLQEETE